MPENTTPHTDLAAEERLLGTVLASTKPHEAWSRLTEHVYHPAMFYGRNNRLIALLITRLASERPEFDAASVADYAKTVRFDDAMQALTLLTDIDAKGGLANAPGRTAAFVSNGWGTEDSLSDDDSVLAALGGFMGIIKLTGSSLGNDKMISGTAKLVSRLYKKRNSIKIVEKLFRDVQSADANPESLIESAHKSILSMEGKTGSGDFQDAIEEILSVESETSSQIAGKTGIKWLDQSAPLLCGAFTCVSGTPGSGKSSFALQVALETEKYHEGAPRTVLYISREMDGKDLAYIRLSKTMRIPAIKLKIAKRSEDFEAHVRQDSDSWAKGGIRIQETREKLDIDDICSCIRSEHRTGGGNLRLVVVDHLGRLDRRHPGQSEVDSIKEITNRLSNLAKHLGVHIMLLAQFNKASREVGRDRAGNVLNNNPEPHVSGLRGSSSIEDDAEIIYILWPQDEEEELKERGLRPYILKVPKNRYGPPIAGANIYFKKLGQSFLAADTAPVEEYHTKGSQE